jgi:hypothetical protein
LNAFPSNGTKLKNYTLDITTLTPDWTFEDDVESYNKSLPALSKVVKGTKNITSQCKGIKPMNVSSTTPNLTMCAPLL